MDKKSQEQPENDIGRRFRKMLDGSNEPSNEKEPFWEHQDAELAGKGNHVPDADIGQPKDKHKALNGEKGAVLHPEGKNPDSQENALGDNLMPAEKGGKSGIVADNEGESTGLDETIPPEDDESATPVPPALGETPQKPPPALDTQGMPLPKRVDEIDLEATQATPTAYKFPRIGKPKQKEDAQNMSNSSGRGLSKRGKPRIDIASYWGCFPRMIILGLFVLIVSGLCLGSFAIYEYFDIAKTLPDVNQLRESASQFETTRILDKNGNVLYEILDPHAGRRTYVTLDEISPYLIAATIATEDKDFYLNPGYDALGIVRAFWQNFNSGETVSGASTITQQLVRLLLFSPEERSQRNYMRKIREAILAAEVTRRYSKDEILELYLNEIYYGNLAYGVEAASQTYFGKSAKNLNLAEAAFLAGLPQLPSVYDVYTNREVTLNRQHDVLLLMYQASLEKGCLYVSNNLQPICIGAGEAALAAKEIEEYQFKKPNIGMKFPHWVNYIRSQLEEMYDPQTIYRSGFDVYTTIDPGLQDDAQQIIRQQVNKLKDRHVTDGALVAIRPSTGEILAMVGSADFYDEDIDGQINMAIVPRQPGSSIKPITYVGTFEKGWTPATLIWDVPSEFPPSGYENDPRPPYKPVNYDGRFHGPVTVRTALANSYNIPAVKALAFLGIYDDEGTPEQDGFLSLAERLGISTLNRDDYGLSLTLGGGEVSLLEMTKVYAVFSNGGRNVKVHGISKIVDHSGEVVYEYKPNGSEQLIRPEHAFLISSILSDNQARTPAFGANSVLKLPFPAAVKTGTTNDFRDNWTIGYTPDVAVGVWVGNADYTPMVDTSGLTGAAPIWAEFMQDAIQSLTGGNPTPFVMPAGIVERIICEVSGTEPSRWCPSQTREYFAADQLPLPKEEDLWKKVLIDTWTELLASPECHEYTKEKLALNVQDPWAIEWIEGTSQGKAWAAEMGFEDKITFVPTRVCNASDPRPILGFVSPRDGDVVHEDSLEIIAKADATALFKRYRLEYGKGTDPVKWHVLKKDSNAVTKPESIYTWDVREMDSGVITLRLYLESKNKTYAEVRIHIDLQVPTPTPTSTPTPTMTPTATFTPTNSPTPTVTNTATPNFTPTWTPIPIFTIAPSPTP